jgi:PAS domain S-box-containing protein
MRQTLAERWIAKGDDHTADQLRVVEGRLALAQEVARMGYWDWDTATNTVECSDELYRIFGLPLPSEGGAEYTAYQGVHPEDLTVVQNAIANGLEAREPYEVEHRVVHPSGEERVVVARGVATYGADGEPTRVFGISYDVTEHRRAEQQLRQAQKMDAVGSLAAGIAHDFNNILLVILGLSEIVLASSTDEHVLRNVGKIDQAAEHAAELTHQLLAFSRQQALRPEVTDLNNVVSEALGVLSRTLGENIDVRPDLDPTLQRILIDRSQLMQVLFNLAVNARDAMPFGGTLSIQTTNAHLDEAFARAHAGVTAGPHVLLQVGDSGQGMTEEVRERVFDPFFTTKGEGTGLGLATVYGIVRQSGGYIWLYSEPGLGTIFKIYLPSTTEVAADPSPAPAPVPLLHGSGKILVVEDEEMVRLLVAELLESFGYEVRSASGPGEALALPEEELRSFDVLMTDIVMPEMTGRELAEKLVAVHPALRVLFTSGYPEDVAIRTEIGEARAHFIDKPYRSAELAAIVQKMLVGTSTD